MAGQNTRKSRREGEEEEGGLRERRGKKTNNLLSRLVQRSQDRKIRRDFPERKQYFLVL